MERKKITKSNQVQVAVKEEVITSGQRDFSCASGVSCTLFSYG
jgi:hypothetical protein